jgi:sigma-B regulation protein RsbU (phosphoserine phosphatase)
MEGNEQQLLDSNRQMQAELKMAGEFQRAVLPDIADIHYLDISLLYEPLGEVSGDVYDFLPNREGELGIFLGDATGHGVPAALMTMMVLIALESLQRNLSTDESLRRLNCLITSRNTGRSVSGVFMRISPDGKLCAANAGHPPMIIIPAANDDLVLFQEAGCALGVFDDEPVPYVEECYQLQQGDRVLAYTDAVIEQRNTSKVPFGTDRLLNFISNNRRAKDCGEMLQSLVIELERFSGGAKNCDDMTVLACQYQSQTCD